LPAFLTTPVEGAEDIGRWRSDKVPVQLINHGIETDRNIFNIPYGIWNMEYGIWNMEYGILNMF
jgi:hypothetical protein